MDTRIVKIYYEYLAKLILETFLPDNYHDLILSDAPDLRANETTGIEVTRAMIDGEGQASGIFEHIRDKKINDIDRRYINTLDKIDYQVLTPNDTVVGYGPKEAMFINDIPLRRALSKKVEKMSHYNMNTIDLFIYSPMDDWFEEDIVQEFMEWSVDKGGSLFRRIIVFEHSNLYEFETANQTFSKIMIDKCVCLQCIKDAKTYALSQASSISISDS